MDKVKGLPDNLPVTDIGVTFVPLIAASILVYREEKFGGVKRLLRRAFDVLLVIAIVVVLIRIIQGRNPFSLLENITFRCTKKVFTCRC